jgi:sterol desaturase/sphingolipid hydroxylase (fatty acid hydroxylase superfamily)
VDKIIKALGIAVLSLQIINLVYIIVFTGDVFNNSAQLNGEKVFYIVDSGINDFLLFETMIFVVSVILVIILIELETYFIHTLRKIIKMDEIEER